MTATAFLVQKSFVGLMVRFGEGLQTLFCKVVMTWSSTIPRRILFKTRLNTSSCCRTIHLSSTVTSMHFRKLCEATIRSALSLTHGNWNRSPVNTSCTPPEWFGGAANFAGQYFKFFKQFWIQHTYFIYNQGFHVFPCFEFFEFFARRD